MLKLIYTDENIAELIRKYCHIGTINLKLMPLRRNFLNGILFESSTQNHL